MLSIPVFMFAGVLFVLSAFIVSALVAPRKHSAAKNSVYECGERPIGNARIQYNVRFYLFALVFLVFDAETIFLYPWAVVARAMGVDAILEMFVFLGVLALGLVYLWKKGNLEWL